MDQEPINNVFQKRNELIVVPQISPVIIPIRFRMCFLIERKRNLSCLKLAQFISNPDRIQNVDDTLS